MYVIVEVNIKIKIDQRLPILKNVTPNLNLTNYLKFRKLLKIVLKRHNKWHGVKQSATYVTNILKTTDIFLRIARSYFSFGACIFATPL